MHAPQNYDRNKSRPQNVSKSDQYTYCAAGGKTQPCKAAPRHTNGKKVWQIICLTLNHFHNGNPSAAGKPELLVFQRLRKIPPLQTKMQSNKSI